jgi:hypothetical protein
MVTDVDRSGVWTVHKEDKTVDEIVDVLERPGLLTVTVDSHILALESLDDEVGDDSAVVGVHSGPEGVEDTGDSDIHRILPHVTVGKSLSDSFTLVVTSSGSDTVDVTPVVFSLGVFLGVTVDLGGGGDEETSLGSLGETEHVEGTHEPGLEGFDRVVLVVRRRCGAGQVVDLYGA